MKITIKQEIKMVMKINKIQMRRNIQMIQRNKYQINR